MIVLVALDFSEITEAVLAAVHKLSADRSPRFYLLHVAEPDPEFVGWKTGPDAVRDQVAGVYRREHRRIDELAAELRDAGHDATGLMVQGPTVATILDEAEKLKADIIVVGSHGHGAAYELLVGGVSAEVIRRSTLPVLVVPHGGHKNAEERLKP
jgi:nucleotide-binding universal stress UspA family protein